VILDSSAILAILLEEPGVDQLLLKLRGASLIAVGGPTLAETGIVLSSRLGIDARAFIGRFLQELSVTVLPFGERHWLEAVGAFRCFGKGRHPAALNLGDCMSYAVARLANQPLLCVGKDFPKTDLNLA
jgi:ribonuclease VapC